MSWIENILIILGISLDTYATMEVEGAMLAEVKKKQLVITCALVALLQLIFYFGGYFICSELDKHELIPRSSDIGYIVAAVVFAMLGIRLIVKAIKREIVHEKRKDGLKVREYIKIVVVTSFYTLVAGGACGLVETSVAMMAVVIIVLSILAVIAGIYTGLHFGIETKTGTYVMGAIVLWIVGVEVLLVHVFGMIG